MRFIPPRPRRVYYDDVVERIILNEIEEDERLGDVVLFLEAFLAYAPDNEFSESIGHQLCYFESRLVPGLNSPYVGLIYSYNDERVTFHNIRVEK